MNQRWGRRPLVDVRTLCERADLTKYASAFAKNPRSIPTTNTSLAPFAKSEKRSKDGSVLGFFNSTSNLRFPNR